MSRSKQKRSYPPFYEKAVPFAIGALAIIVFGVLVYALAIATGLLSFQ